LKLETGKLELTQYLAMLNGVSSSLRAGGIMPQRRAERYRETGSV